MILSDNECAATEDMTYLCSHALVVPYLCSRGQWRHTKIYQAFLSAIDKSPLFCLSTFEKEKGQKYKKYQTWSVKFPTPSTCGLYSDAVVDKVIANCVLLCLQRTELYWLEGAHQCFDLST